VTKEREFSSNGRWDRSQLETIPNPLLCYALFVALCGSARRLVMEKRNFRRKVTQARLINNLKRFSIGYDRCCSGRRFEATMKQDSGHKYTRRSANRLCSRCNPSFLTYAVSCLTRNPKSLRKHQVLRIEESKRR